MEQILAHVFSAFSRWEAEFRRTANALSGGSGWVILARAPEGDLHNYWAWDHTAFAAGLSRPPRRARTSTRRRRRHGIRDEAPIAQYRSVQRPCGRVL